MGDTWLALLGAGIPGLGEVKVREVLYEKQLAATIADLAGTPYVHSTKVAPPLDLVIASKEITAAPATSIKDVGNKGF